MMRSLTSDPAPISILFNSWMFSSNSSSFSRSVSGFPVGVMFMYCSPISDWSACWFSFVVTDGELFVRNDHKIRSPCRPSAAIDVHILPSVNARVEVRHVRVPDDGDPASFLILPVAHAAAIVFLDRAH